MTAPTDLAALFSGPVAGPAQNMAYRQGIVRTWDPLTAMNTVEVGGTILSNLPVLNTSEASVLTAGSVVAVVVIGDEGAKTFAILGRLTIPGSADAASALNIFRDRVLLATVTASESVSSVAYTDMATVGPRIMNVPIATGRALVFCAADMQPTPNDLGYMNVEVSGATSVSPSSAALDPQAYIVGWGPADMVPVSATRPILVTGLNVGYHTFTAKYRTGFAVGVTIRNRSLIVFAL